MQIRKNSRVHAFGFQRVRTAVRRASFSSQRLTTVSGRRPCISILPFCRICHGVAECFLSLKETFFVFRASVMLTNYPFFLLGFHLLVSIFKWLNNSWNTNGNAGITMDVYRQQWMSSQISSAVVARLMALRASARERSIRYHLPIIIHSHHLIARQTKSTYAQRGILALFRDNEELIRILNKI